LTGEPIFNNYYKLWKNYNLFDNNVKQIKMSSKTDQCSNRADNNGYSLIGNENPDCSTKNFDINRDNSVDFDKAIDNNSRDLAPSFSPPTIVLGKEYSH
jgi:hypothetical protein